MVFAGSLGWWPTFQRTLLILFAMSFIPRHLSSHSLAKHLKASLAETLAFCGHDEARYQVTVFLGVSHGFLITGELIYWTCSSNSKWDFSKLYWALRMWRPIKSGRSIRNVIQIRYGGASAGTTWGVSGPLMRWDYVWRNCSIAPRKCRFFHLWIVSNAHWATSNVNHHKRRQV